MATTARKLLSRIVEICSFCLLVSGQVFAQCPMCKAALTSSAEGQRLVIGFDRGILFLLGVPFLLVAVIGTRIVQAQRRQTRRVQERKETTRVAGDSTNEDPPVFPVTDGAVVSTR